ncbi:Phosphatase 2c putative isoform 1 [Tripterygium wilfordii]|uniref:protein-serine/threonine phosphatase n=1 Tax=Tripterygium wilfordii TaxID=458696 RepID=A0A7J7DQC0_TRIWF|nr:protein phosphatase 2C and cyclic nucleotide-binding/kinase domain-containing protein [Tripterygium wilfordii]KAF5748558.1 Phosphatase 2c putative isoform 1 [Tripterygium wilfordii]
MGCVYSRACIGEVCAPRIKQSQIPNNPTTSNATGVPVFSPASSDDQETEVRDQINVLNHARDSELGITRLSRVSAQFLPSDGSRAVKVPSDNFELRYSFLSQRGYYPDALDKANQDSFCIHTPFGTSLDDHFFGVFDGHGEFGAHCSQFVKRKLCENLLRDKKFHADAVEACHTAFLATNSQLHADPNVDDSMSGTTAITVLVRGRTIYVANSGDSRAVIAERRGKDIVAVDLSIDQTPFRADEAERVKLCGARVLTLDQIEGLKNPYVQCWGTEEADDGDPPRLWVPNGMYPGTAFTRSIGDSIAETIGVVANPETVVFELTPNHPFFVLASDGVFEFLSSQSVVDMVAKYTDPRDACAAIVAESYRLWLQYETRTDDITVIVVHITGLNNTAVCQSTGHGAAPRSPIPQVFELTGSESPATYRWSSRNHRVRHDLSRARLRAIESSLENGQVWAPPSPAHRKTWEEEAHIEQALRDHFLFKKLNDSQCHVLLDCMQRVEVQAGDVVVKQGAEGDCFYVVGSGEFEVLAIQEEQNGEVPKVLQLYTAEKLSSFGELALMYNKPLQASVRAVTHGTLWALKREDFRGILMSKFSNLSSLKLLRSVDLLSRLTILQLSCIADYLSEVSFSDGQTIIDWNDGVFGLYLIQKGQVNITFDAELLSSPNICSLKSENQGDDDHPQVNNKLSLEKREGSYFGEWALLGEQSAYFNAVAVGDVVCAVLTKDKFDSVVGPLAKVSHDDQKSNGNASDLHVESAASTDTSTRDKVHLSDLEWKTCLYSTDCSDIGLVLLKDSVHVSENMLSLKRFSKQRVKKLGKEAQVLKEKNLMKSVSSYACVPEILGTCADQIHAAILLKTRLACPLASILRTPLDEPSARFCTAFVVIALEDLHKNGILYRGISPDVLMLDQTGHLQLVDFRFAKKLSGERTFTICGMTDSLAPEIVQGNGHGLPADWWALGVLIYFMLQGEMPFGSWRESELDTFAKIAKGQLNITESLSSEAVDLISKLLEVDEGTRLGSQDPDSVKSHPWFHGVDWNGIRDCSFPVPHEIISRVTQRLESHLEDCAGPLASPSREVEDLNVPEWFDDW